MFLNRTLNNRINRIHERRLRTLYRDDASNFTELLQKENALTAHHRSLQILATEVYKVNMDFVPHLLKERFTISTQA